MENVFYFTSKSLFILKIFKFLSWLFAYVAKRIDQKDKVNFKFHDITAWLTNNQQCIAQYFEKQRQSDSEFGQLIACDTFFEKS